MKVFVAVSLVLFIATVHAGYIQVGDDHGRAQEVYEANDFNGQKHAASQEHNIDYYDEPKYAFNYAVHDPHTGDVKQHVEERDGHVVKGAYTLKEADGTTRVVEYQADKHNGFNAKVHKIGESVHHY